MAIGNDSKNHIFLPNFEATEPAPEEDVPSEMAWFNLFNGIAESLKVQADATRAEIAAEVAFEAQLKENGMGGLFGDLLNPDFHHPKEDPTTPGASADDGTETV